MVRPPQQQLEVYSKGLITLYSARDMESLKRRMTACLRQIFCCNVDFAEVDSDLRSRNFSRLNSRLLVARKSQNLPGGTKESSPMDIRETLILLWPHLRQACKVARTHARVDRRAGKSRRGSGGLKVHSSKNSLSKGRRLLWLVEENDGEHSIEGLARLHGLSRREGQVLYWMGQGKTNGEISVILAIAHRTVEKYVERLFEKLRVHNRTAAARVALGL